MVFDDLLMEGGYCHARSRALCFASLSTLFVTCVACVSSDFPNGDNIC